MTLEFRIGADENGLGARLGPLVVTAVLARVSEAGQRVLSRRLPRTIRPDLDDSKRLVAHGNVALGEAWARVVGGLDAATPEALIGRLALEDAAALRAPCPGHVEAQCWSPAGEKFDADDELLSRIGRHRATLAERGVEIVCAKSSIVCTKLLNDARRRGHSRFSADLHAMERLVLALRDTAGEPVVATCGKVGGIDDYDRFFGPLSGWLHTTLEQTRRRSSYHFPKIGRLSFLMDADAKDPLVMLASLIGKWVRELLMARVARFYGAGSDAGPPDASGYNDPVTDRFVEQTALVRRKRRVPDTCFERESEGPFVAAVAGAEHADG